MLSRASNAVFLPLPRPQDQCFCRPFLRSRGDAVCAGAGRRSEIGTYHYNPRHVLPGESGNGQARQAECQDNGKHTRYRRLTCQNRTQATRTRMIGGMQE